MGGEWAVGGGEIFVCGILKHPATGIHSNKFRFHVYEPSTALPLERTHRGVFI